MAVLVLLLSLPVTLARAETAGAVTCSDVSTPISVPGADPGTIYGHYCRTAVRNGNPLQILVPGSTYSHVYWDLPGVDGRYSYARFMHQHGYDTLAIDRLGIGRSTRPTLAAFVDANANADALHQVVDSVRAHGVAGRHYRRIVLTGHSYGTFGSELTAATYGGVDGIIGTGWLQGPTPQGNMAVFSLLYAAAMDPRFKDTLVRSHISPGTSASAGSVTNPHYSEVCDRSWRLGPRCSERVRPWGRGLPRSDLGLQEVVDLRDG